jgi:hypothetical protein
VFRDNLTLQLHHLHPRIITLFNVKTNTLRQDSEWILQSYNVHLFLGAGLNVMTCLATLCDKVWLDLRFWLRRAVYFRGTSCLDPQGSSGEEGQDGGSMLLWNVGTHLADYMVS